MPDPIRLYEYISRDKYPPKDAQSTDAQPMDVPIGGMHIIFDHQVASDDEDPGVVHLWANEELKLITGKEKPQNGSRAG